VAANPRATIRPACIQKRKPPIAAAPTRARAKGQRAFPDWSDTTSV